MRKAVLLLPFLLACRAPQASVPVEAPMAASDSGLWLRIEPTQIDVALGATFTFRPNLNYPKDRRYLRPPVKWSVQEADGGTIDAMGHYTAPVGTGTFHVLVERTDVEGVRAIATVTVK